MTVRAPADKHFRRARAKPSRRRREWGPRWFRLVRTIVVIMLVCYAALRATDLVRNASMLTIDSLDVHGNEHLSSGEVLALVDGLRGQNILTADLQTWRARLIGSPWVKDAALRKIVPSTVEITVSERTPMGIGRVRGRLYLVDGEGTVIAEYGPQYADVDRPIIDGLAVGSKAGRPVIDTRRAALAARVVESVRTDPDLASRISQVDVHDRHDVTVILDGDPALIHLGHEKFLARLQAYVDMTAALRARVPAIDYVDLRFGERVYVRPAASAGRSSDRQ